MTVPLRHIVLVVSLMPFVSLALLVGPAEAAANARVSEWVRDDAMPQQAARPRQRPVQPEPATPVDVPPPAEPLAPAPGGLSTAPVIAADGAVETRMTDGSTRRARPGDCGWTIVRPDGSEDGMRCRLIDVQRVNLPAPDNASAAWLEAHGNSLLAIARTLLGGNATSLENYLKTVESEGPSVYERIRLRTDLITKLTGQ